MTENENLPLNRQIALIRRQIIASRNGETLHQMQREGILYKKSYGVDIPRLRQIAAAWKSDKQIAEQLWTLSIRETQILATMLYPPEEFDRHTAEKWLKDFTQTELIEQAVQNLLCKLPYAETLCIEWIEKEDYKAQTCAFLTAARIYQSLSTDSRQKINQKAILIASSEDYSLVRSISVCLSRFCRIDTASREEVNSALMQLPESKQAKLITDVVKQEIAFIEEAS